MIIYSQYCYEVKVTMPLFTQFLCNIIVFPNKNYSMHDVELKYLPILIVGVLYSNYGTAHL